MSPCEHLMENALTALEQGKDFEYFKDDINFEFVPDVKPEDVWEMAQYVYFTYLPFYIAENMDNAILAESKDN